MRSIEIYHKMKKILLILISVSLVGCFEKPTYEVDYNITMGPPYSIGPTVIDLKEDISIDVSIKSSWERPITLTIDEAEIEAEFSDGSSEKITGTVGNSTYFLDPNDTLTMSLFFKGIPLRYRMMEHPMRLQSMANYTVTVDYIGETKLFGLIPISEEGRYNQTITPRDINLEDFISSQNIF